MEELQVIETTSGRQFKPWASKEDVQAAVQDPASVTAIASEIASGKQVIAAAINAKGGTAEATESFSELADDISNAIFDTTTDVVFEEGFTPRSAYDIVMNRGKIKSLICRGVTFTDTQLQYLTGLESISFPDLISTFIPNNTITSSCANLKVFRCDNIIQVGLGQAFDFASTNNSVDFYMEKCTSLDGGIARGFKIGRLFLGDVTRLNTGSAGYYAQVYLSVLSLKSGDGNFNCSNWTASIVGPLIGWDKMNENLYDYTLSKLADHSQDGITRTLGLGWLANVSAENIAYANAKGWTLTT